MSRGEFIERGLAQPNTEEGTFHTGADVKAALLPTVFPESTFFRLGFCIEHLIAPFKPKSFLEFHPISVFCCFVLNYI